jgi:hypothetical protein
MSIIKVKTGGITADAITDALIADDVVGTEHLTANEVDTTALGADAVTGAQLADDAVNSEHYTDGSVDTAHIADAQITTAKLSTAVLTGATDIGADLADADLFLVDDGAGGTLRKTAASRIKSYVGGGITMASQWRLTTSFTGDAAPIASNWEQNDGSDPAVSYYGAQMTESSGVFTFPSTGIYYVELLVGYYINGDSGYNHSLIAAATNGSTFNTMTECTTFITGNSSANTWASTTGSIIMDVRSLSEDLVRFDINVDSSGTTIIGNSTRDITAARFIRLADT